MKKAKLYVWFLAVLLLATAAAYMHFQPGKDSYFEIKKEENRTSDIDENDLSGQHPATEPQKNEEDKAIDLAWAVEKYKGKEILKVATEQKIVALTFDAGANADGVDKILPILAENGIEGTFFLTGKFIEKFPDKVKAIIASEGEIGNHSYDHPYFTQLSDNQIKDEIQKTETALGKLGKDARFNPFLRSPYGDRNNHTLGVISESGYINIRWTIDSLGWKGTSGGMSKQAVEDKVLEKVQPGAIIMMHLGSNPDDKTHLDSEALPGIISKLKENGYEFTTLSNLIGLQK